VLRKALQQLPGVPEDFGLVFGPLLERLLRALDGQAVGDYGVMT
jgi:hypothetical protein